MKPFIAIGELLVDFVSTGPDVAIQDAPGFVKTPGGAPANVAVAAARMGLPAAFIGKVGDDPFGAFLRATLDNEGVSTHALLTDADARTTLAFIATRRDGRKEIAFYRNPGADARLAPEDLPVEALQSCACIHFGSVSLSREPARSATLEAVRIAKDSGALISFDPNWRPPVWGDPDAGRSAIWDAMPLADVVKLAEEEWEFVTGTSDLEAGARKVLAAGPRLLFVTLGEQGAWYDNGRQRGTLPGFSVEVADTLGAGDAFVGAVVSELLAAPSLDRLPETELRRITRFGNAAGALSCLKPGAIPALPFCAEVEAFLASHPTDP